MIDKILNVAILKDASDIHLAVGVPPVIRIYGKLHRLDTKVLDAEDTSSFVKSIASERFQLQLAEEGSCNFSLEFQDRAFRVNACQERRGMSLVLRLIANEIKTPQELGLAPSVLDAVRKDRGLVLATGATGSGKSTSLAALLNMLAADSGKRIVTIEQPIEYRFPHHSESVVTQREVPLHTKDFADAVADVLRQDPDIIMVGELRTCEEMRVAISAAETGHIVLSTLHTNSAAESVDRLVGSFPADEQNLIRMQLSLSLNAIISQKLLPLKTGVGRVLVHEVLTMSAGV
ncbi:UNVERIFIED_CONTAM: hypothetical protein GTU68_008319, partial [Idotea baltica]|nr:hypothetical protein [Idotea baltica]